MMTFEEVFTDIRELTLHHSNLFVGKANDFLSSVFNILFHN